MLDSLFKKWWIILIQAILLLILSFYIFNHPVAILTSLSLWFGLLVLGTGIIGIITWLSAEKEEKEGMSILWNIASTLFGVLMLSNLLATSKFITILFGLWMILTGFFILKLGWQIKQKNTLGWFMVLAGVFSIVSGIMMLFNIGVAAVGISTLLGCQVFATGVALLFLSFAKKAMVGKVKDKIEAFKSDYKM
jgi:uncharacterized membrane protein HdeD (DUF308 family)